MDLISFILWFTPAIEERKNCSCKQLLLTVFSILNNQVNTCRSKSNVFRPLICTYVSGWNRVSQLKDGRWGRKGNWQMNVSLVSRSVAAFVNKCLCLSVCYCHKKVISPSALHYSAWQETLWLSVMWKERTLLLLPTAGGDQRAPEN